MTQSTALVSAIIRFKARTCRATICFLAGLLLNNTNTTAQPQLCLPDCAHVYSALHGKLRLYLIIIVFNNRRVGPFLVKQRLRAGLGSVLDTEFAIDLVYAMPCDGFVRNDAQLVRFFVFAVRGPH